ncbi:hypothetical protein TVAG_099550 [Trichomonas vaginalis G3]|uniref:EF-hand domain-containing protein n=1 Tax=Trichomonas vaginalis (strain ATCC PRA-98 / G3) TaxID=412133 RepID=A2FXW3_TRIV3|nr:EF-hand family [Trichomonas vaginalis G3]EAX90267.1 hypothetical protein TVAG_099550 [Trichomonas vaginalis G3]KAI5499869.1 EF-hand family [Trichomonas vaginalis G3]|eukprot:XP_001303197.1 hypothetical protein [Trichomonas vaginalis G3]
MPLTQEEINQVTESYRLLDPEQKNKLGKAQLTSLFNDLKLDLTDKQKDVIIDGMLACNQKANLQTCINTVSCLHDQDELGILKIAFRGLDQNCTRKLSLDQAVEITEVLKKQVTREQLSESLSGNTEKGFSFSKLAKVLLDITIPENVDPFSGIGEKSKCCLLI